ncbi:MAG: NAD(P)-dependent oxidoreductase [bacterium]|nr:NAD(P)-dependent oxidoreductase [bacterium]
MKTVFFEVKNGEQDFIQDKLKSIDLSFYSEETQSSNIKKEDFDAEIISIFIYSKIDKELLDKFKNLKMICTRSTGTDHIDIEECERRDIEVKNVPFYGENTVAEHTFALILSISRNIHKSYLRSQRDDFSIDDLCGFDLRGKTLGVIGVGHIGKHVVKIAKGFGMDVIAFDNNEDHILAEVLNFEYSESIDKLLEKSDIISLHLPLNEKTHHLINTESFSKMKKGAILINTARGGLVDIDALYQALKSGHLFGAGLDVIEGEEVIKEEKELLFSAKNVGLIKTLFESKAIFKMDNVVFTPHNAFNSKEAVERILNNTVENIKGFLEK